MINVYMKFLVLTKNLIASYFQAAALNVITTQQAIDVIGV